MQSVSHNSYTITLLFRESEIQGPNARNSSLMKFRVKSTALHYSMTANEEVASNDSATRLLCWINC